MNEKRAFGLMKIKAVNEETREITGIASTITADRSGDVMEPAGAKFNLPIPLLWQHDHRQPIGQVTEAKVTDNGIEIKASLIKVDSPSQMSARLEEAWQSIKSGLVRGLSIGFSAIEYAFIDNGGIHFTQWDWYELSVVTVPANVDASIQTIKSFYHEQAAVGNSSINKKQIAGASAKKTIVKINDNKEKSNMNLAEQIKSFEAKRLAQEAAREEIMAKAAEEGRTLDEEELETFDELTSEIKIVDGHLKRLHELESAKLKSAKPVEKSNNNHTAKLNRAPSIVKTVKEQEPGIAFAKLALAMRAGKGNMNDAKSFAESVYHDDTRVNNILKAAVSAASTTDPEWAGNLVDYRTLSSEFIDFLRPQTIVGKFGLNGVPSLRRVPFNIKIKGKSKSGNAGWVGEGYAKPVTSSAYNSTELKWAKIAAISVVTEELARFSDPSIQALVRDDLAEAVIERMDIDFINPAKGEGTGDTPSPASITNDAKSIPSKGNDAESIADDIDSLWDVADEANLPTSNAVYIASPKSARALAKLKNPMGQKVYPDVTVNGGNIDGVPLIVSNYVPTDEDGSIFVLAFASEILLADDGIVTIDTSREASILMETNPDMNSIDPKPSAQLVSMFQTNSIAILAERFVNWKKRRPQAVAYVKNVKWGNTGGGS